MSNKTKILNKNITVGDLIKVHHKVTEGNKQRIQIFQGIVISIRGRQENKSFTVRRIGAGGIGIEKIWPVMSPVLTKIEIKRKGKTRRAKLYYLRKRYGKEAIRVKINKDKDSNQKSPTPKTRENVG